MVNILAWLQEWATVISGIGSLTLTFGLVYLYWKQQNLLKRELNREVRENHTRTLRERIRAWHGDMDEVGDADIDLFSDDTRLPKVQAASVKPAPPIMQDVTRDWEFRVVPELIENDRYLHDLLENHAPELKSLKETIEGQYNEFSSAKQSFIDEYPESDAFDNGNYVMEPMDEFPKWIFERAVILHREYRNRDKEKMRDIAKSRLEDGNGLDQDTGGKFYSPTSLDGGHPSTYKVTPHSGEYEDLEKSEDEIHERLVEIHHEAIDEVNDSGVYEYAVTAAETLDAMEETVQDLKSKLVEHEGHPLYTEDCEFIEEGLV